MSENEKLREIAVKTDSVFDAGIKLLASPADDAAKLVVYDEAGLSEQHNSVLLDMRVEAAERAGLVRMSQSQAIELLMGAPYNQAETTKESVREVREIAYRDEWVEDD